MEHARNHGAMKRALTSFRVWLCLVIAVASLCLGYFCTRPLLPLLHMHQPALPIDERIPFVPEWVIVYVLSYVIWVVSAVVIFSQSREHALRFAGAYALAMLIAAVIFVAWPLTLQQPEVTGSGPVRDLMRLIYLLDEPNNLFPSAHVLNSYICWRGLWGCPRVPGWFKWLNFIALILVCMSVVLVKQHLVIDIPGGIAVGELALQVARMFRLERPLMRLEEALCARLGRTLEGDI